MRCFIIALCSHIYLLLLVLPVFSPTATTAVAALELDWQQIFTFGENKTVTEPVPSTMKEAIILKGPEVKIVDTPIPKAEPGQVVVKVVYSGSNPKDWVCQYLQDQAESCHD